MRFFLILIGFAFLTGSCSSTRSATGSTVGKPGSGEHKSESKFLNDISISTGGGSGAGHREADIPHLPDDHKLSGSYMFPPFNIEQGNALQFKYAIKLDVEVERLKNTNLYNFIESWWGAPYRMGGSTQKGVDCSAFTQMLMSVIYGLQIPRTAREQKTFCNDISKEDLREGDLVFFNTRGRGITHVGIYLQDNKFVHAASSGGVMISSLSESYWQKKLICAGRAVDDKTAAAVSLSGR